VFYSFVCKAKIGNLLVARKLLVKLTSSFRQLATNCLNFLPITATYYRVYIRAILFFSVNMLAQFVLTALSPSLTQ
jgi:hypothetical protein